MHGYCCLVLHAHLPFVRHPENPLFLEENWLFEGVAETYLPLLQVLRNWHSEGLRGQLTITLTPTLCAMLKDPLLQERCLRYLEGLVDLAEKETCRTMLEPTFHGTAEFYLERFRTLLKEYLALDGDLVDAFRRHQDDGVIEIITCAATHAVLPLLAENPGAIRGQLLTARDDYIECFGRAPRGIWLPECGYGEVLEPLLAEAGLRWFILESHGVLHARPRPRYSVFAPILTPGGLAAFGRDIESAKQVWSRAVGYPGDPRYRDFYRDAGFDLDFEYLRRHFPAGEERGFTGIKYHRVGEGPLGKEPYERNAALEAVEVHAEDFIESRTRQAERLAKILNRPPVLVCPYDAELFGHWWFEGPEFLDAVIRKAVRRPELSFVTPESFLRQCPVLQKSTPAMSSWGEGGYWQVWLNEKNQWIYPELGRAAKIMTDVARDVAAATPLQERALRQAARELLLAQSSDWAFMIHTGTNPDYARKRVRTHLQNVTALCEQARASRIDLTDLQKLESRNNLFPNVDYRYWT
jgi:1,4-alpha-glucan branching enzyme